MCEITDIMLKYDEISGRILIWLTSISSGKWYETKKA